MVRFLQPKAAYCCSGNCTGWTNQENVNNSVGVCRDAGSSVHLTYIWQCLEGGRETLWILEVQLLYGRLKGELKRDRDWCDRWSLQGNVKEMSYQCFRGWKRLEVAEAFDIKRFGWLVHPTGAAMENTKDTRRSERLKPTKLLFADYFHT